eukprot:TRINITY_DN18915_c0_g1_i1.p1 TRINITY_DN18915_c0_g1~~TRINITY_DN18915_c0_g1_i1.p1  ORF type:complete len:337 (+),score=95.07 TRINITY_DN18915_c0_g1_i1:112-1122(+)
MMESTVSPLQSTPSPGESPSSSSGNSSDFEIVDTKKGLPPPAPLPVFSNPPPPVQPATAVKEELSQSPTQDLPPPPTSVSPPVETSETSLMKYEEEVGIMSSLGLGWMSGSLFSKVAETTKSSFETVITTLDPQMRDYLNGKFNIPFAPEEVVIASDQDSNVSPISNAFRGVFGSKTAVYGLPSKVEGIAEQPVGFAAGRQGAKERMNSISPDSDVIVAVQNFLLEVGEDSWVEMITFSLFNSKMGISLSNYSQPVPVDVRFVDLAKEATLETYPRKWSGLQKSIASVIGEKCGTLYQDWYPAVTGGTTREEIMFNAADTLAKMYRKVLSERVDNV